MAVVCVLLVGVRAAPAYAANGTTFEGAVEVDLGAVQHALVTNNLPLELHLRFIRGKKGETICHVNAWAICMITIRGASSTLSLPVCFLRQAGQ